MSESILTPAPRVEDLTPPWPILYPLFKQVLPWFNIGENTPKAGTLLIQLGDGLTVKVVTHSEAVLLILLDSTALDDPLAKTLELCRIACRLNDRDNMTGFVLKCRAESDKRTGRALPMGSTITVGAIRWAKQNERHDSNPLCYENGPLRVWQTTEYGKPVCWCWSFLTKDEAGDHQAYLRFEDAARAAIHNSPPF